MNNLSITQHNGEARISSRQLAVKLGNQHKNVVGLISEYHAEFEQLGRVAFETEALKTAGGKQQTRVTYLNEDQCYFLLTLTRNSEQVVALKVALVQAFAMARRQVMQPAIPQTLPDALRLAADLAEQKAKAEAKLAIATPKVEAFETLMNSDGELLMRDVAKTIKGCPFGQNKLFEFLRRHGHLMVNNTPYQDKVTAGYYVERVQSYKRNGKNIMITTTYVTARGVEAIRRLLKKNGLLECVA